MNHRVLLKLLFCAIVLVPVQSSIAARPGSLKTGAPNRARLVSTFTDVIVSTAQGSTTPSLDPNQNPVTNGDFLINQTGATGPTGDGIDEETFWRVVLTLPHDVPNLRVVSAVLTLHLTPKDPNTNNDDLRMEDCGCGAIAVGNHPLNAEYTFTANLLDTYSPQRLLDSIRLDNGWSMSYEDDAILSFAEVRVVVTDAQLAIASPISGDRLVVDQPNTIRWTGTKGIGWFVSLSTDDGLTYTDFDTLLAPADTTLLWTPSDTMHSSSTCRIKVKDASDAALSAESFPFTVRAYELIKPLPDGTFRYFKPSLDGWNFVNDTIPMWPSSWYRQFDYRGNDPFTNKPYPCNLADGGLICRVPAKVFPDWPLFVDAFTINKCYTRTFFTGTLQYDPIAFNKWFVGIAASRGESGSCQGMSTGSLLGFWYPAEFRSEFPHMPAFAFAHDAQLDDTLRKALNELQVFQDGDIPSQHQKANETTSPRTTLQNLKAMFLSETAADAATLAIFDNVHSGGHEIQPYRMERDNVVPGEYHVYAYDPNNPGRDRVHIDIDSLPNSWTDFLPGLGFGTGSKGCYLDVPASVYLAHPALPSPGNRPVASVRASMGFSPEDEKVYCTTSSNTIIQSPGGDSIGFRDSISFNRIPGASRIIPKTGRYSPPIGYDLPVGSYTVTVNAYSDTAASLTIFQSGAMYRCERNDAAPDQTDRFVVGDGFSVTNPDPASRRASFTTIANADSSHHVFVLQDLEIGQNDSLRLDQVSPGDLKVENFGARKSYNFSFTRTDTLGLHPFQHNGVVFGGNSSQEILVSPDSLQNVKILVDQGNDGTIDDTMIVTNELTDVRDKVSVAFPAVYALNQNYPNPFNPVTAVSFQIPKSSFVSLKVYDLLGRETATLVEEKLPAGTYERTWDAGKVASGVYFYRLQAGTFTDVKKMLLMK